MSLDIEKSIIELQRTRELLFEAQQKIDNLKTLREKAEKDLEEAEKQATKWKNKYTNERLQNLLNNTEGLDIVFQTIHENDHGRSFFVGTKVIVNYKDFGVVRTFKSEHNTLFIVQELEKLVKLLDDRDLPKASDKWIFTKVNLGF